MVGVRGGQPVQVGAGVPGGVVGAEPGADVDPAVGADRWIYIGARFGADNTTWYAGPDLDRLTAAYSDHTGVGPDFAAYPILNLSISDGSFHRPPASGDPVTMECDLIMIERPQR
ncbi:hypothetical protein [Kitasatospora paracochleata]|uniref:Uncharacterized protein n=1 Tax=Kitasatospora paracochleata TaxID=58354 RepID=A0ABT1IUN7_9ACTN|nr:hypothetical protein [Kitasatospora paracochleata]MCP2308847.1 hypothetical protein [Kitasatospora paracochleata]